MQPADVFVKGLGVHVPEVEGGAAVAGELPAPDMALLAARHAFSRCGHEPTDVDLLLYASTWHQGPDGWLPQSYLQRRLIGDDNLALSIDQGRGGLLAGLELAAGYLCADPGRRTALLVAADNFGTPLLRRRSGGEVLGDAGAALLLTRELGFARLLSVCSVTVPEAEEMYRAGEPMFPPGATTGRAVDLPARADVFRRRLAAEPAGTALWQELEKRMVEIVHAALGEAGVEPGDIAAAALTALPGGDLEPVLHALRLPPSRSTAAVSHRLGQLGAADPVVALDHLVSAGALRPGDHVVLHTTGAGLTASCAVLRIEGTAPWTT
ncbi:ketoacyl-ACP synthase III family protein [Dactylosporangium sp. NPDC051541]|uniref:ketoacyl-ACP synthase III family protein n=1 Tax=Dactylosporangium sp. NPDC051541 TaxID=3363977 RepID=UPI00378C558D